MLNHILRREPSINITKTLSAYAFNTLSCHQKQCTTSLILPWFLLRCGICTDNNRRQKLTQVLLRKKTRIKPAKRFVPVKYTPKTKAKPDVEIQVWKNMTVTELATMMDKTIDHVYEAMLFVKNSSHYDHDLAMIDNVEVSVQIVKKSGMKCNIISPPNASFVRKPSKDVKARPPPESSELVKRSPVVTIMGHVDHGKTTLLDCIRNSSIVDQEFGGITQHIGAFTVKVSETELITFLDTPGHAAFSAMRARGANVTDIVILVVAADDGVMEQTVESIKYASEADVPIIVAINKIDKPGADITLCKKNLLQHGIQLEEFGGNIQHVEISALKGTGIDTLTEAILTQAELMELKSDPKGLVEGTIIESKVDGVRGKLATVLVQRGTLKKGCVLVAGSAWAKVRAMFNEHNMPIPMASPSSPVNIIGWKELPFSGDEVLEVTSEKQAKEVIEWRNDQKKSEQAKEDSVIIQEKINDHLKVYRAQLEKKRAEGRRRSKPSDYDGLMPEVEEQGPVLSLIIKGDVNGSVEAIRNVLDTYYSHNQCGLDIIHCGAGVVNENDLKLAESFDGVIYAFNVGVQESLKNIVKRNKIKLKKFNVIYHLIDDIKEELNLRLPLLDKEEIIGQATILQNFLVSQGRKKVPVAGCICDKGIIKKESFYRVFRNEEQIYEGSLSSMKHLKSEVNSIKSGVECGLMFEDSSLEFKPGDSITCFDIIQVPQKISWNPGF